MTSPAIDAPDGMFADAALNAEVARNGFAITEVLDKSAVEYLTAEYWKLSADDDDGLTVDYMRPDRGVMSDIRALLDPIWEEHFPRLFVNHRPILTTFVVKHPGESSSMFLHEDRTYTDERQFRAGTMWIPLVDVGPGIPNGGLEVIPGSHQLSSSPSGTNTPDLIRPYETVLREHLVPLEVRAGNAVFYDSRTLHASPPNLSSSPRIAIVCAVVHRDAPLYHYLATGRRSRTVLEIDDDFFVDQHPREIAETAPQQYRTVRTISDPGGIEPSTVKAVLELDDLPTPAPIIPDDVNDHRPIESTSPVVAGIAVTADSEALISDDLPLVAEHLDDSSALETTWRTGISSVLDGPSADLLGSAGVQLRAHPSSITSIALVAPGGRRELLLPAVAFRKYCVQVIDAPRISAGLALDGYFNSAEPTTRIEFRGPRTLTMWNDGPGPMAVVIERRLASAKVTAIADRIARLLPGRSS